MNVAIIGTDSYPSMHTSLLLTSKNQFVPPSQINQSQVNNLQIGTTTPTPVPNVIMANNTILSSNLTPIRAICMPMPQQQQQHPSVQPSQVTSTTGQRTVLSQIKLPPGCTILTGSGQTPNITGRIIYVDRATGQSYIPVLTNASGNLSQIALGNNIPLPIRQPQFAQVASLSTNTTLSPQPSTQHQQTQSNCTGTNENTCGQSDQQSTMQTSNTQIDPSSIPPDVTRNISTVGRRPGPPPPAPEFNLVCNVYHESIHINAIITYIIKRVEINRTPDPNRLQ
ncbi:unnamed protein product [Schistosoma turkestanicum]|nr:unnamed protein product [Schistosoma turkestanicum]